MEREFDVDPTKPVLLIVDPDTGAILQASTEAQHFYGCSLENLKNRKITELMDLREKEFFDEVFVFRRFEPAVFQAVHKLSSGEIRFAEIETEPVVFESRDCLSISVRGIKTAPVAEDELERRTQELLKREKELKCVYEISRLVERSRIPLDALLQSIVTLLPTSCHNSQITSAKIRLEDREYRSSNFQDFICKRVADIHVYGKAAGFLEMCYSDDFDKDLLEIEDNTFLSFVAGRIGRVVERRAVEAALKESEELFRRAFESAPFGMALIGIDARFVKVNQAFASIFGYSEDTLMGMTMGDLTDSSDQELGRNLEKNILEAKTDYFCHERLCRHRQGDLIWAYVSMSAVHTAGEVDYIILQIEDITERKTAEESVRKSEEKYKIVADFNHDWEIWLDPQGKPIYVSPSSERITGYRAEEFYANPDLLFEIVHKDHYEEVLNHHLRVLQESTDCVHDLDFQIVRKDGVQRWINHVCRTVFSDDNVSLGRRISHRDITDRKRAEEELRKNEERFKAVFEYAGDCIYIKDRELRFVEANAATCDLLGLAVNEIQGKRAEDLFGVEAATEIENGDLRVLTGHPVERIHTLPVKGLPMTLHEISVPLKDAHGKVTSICSIARNITELTKAGAPPPTFVEEFPSRAMKNVIQQARIAAGSDVIVLLSGESGSGKDYMARWIHEHSRRSGGPYFVLNCAAVSQEIAESELFGHEAGAFTGARNRKKGLIELAEGGTLVLNEVGELPLMIQSKLLTFLDTRTFLRVGGVKSIQVDVRLIAATHRNLELEMAEGRFLEPLFYRLNVFPVQMPPLRERTEDIPIIVDEILTRLAAEMHLPKVPRFEPTAIAALSKYHWPGNVRELRNAVERALIVAGMGSTTLSVSGLSNTAEDWKYAVDFSTKLTLPEIKEDMTKAFCREALRRCKGNRARAARLLGISRDSLYRYIETFDLDREPVYQ